MVIFHSYGWLVVLSPTPLKNDGVRQLGWWNSHYMESHKIPWFQTTNQPCWWPTTSDPCVAGTPPRGSFHPPGQCGWGVALEPSQNHPWNQNWVRFQPSPNGRFMALGVPGLLPVIGQMTYPLVICYIAIENDPIETVDFPIKNGYIFPLKMLNGWHGWPTDHFHICTGFQSHHWNRHSCEVQILSST